MSIIITIRYHQKDIRLIVALLSGNEKTERYTVSSPGNKFIFERTKPFFLHHGLKQDPEWNLVQPKHLYGTLKEDIIDALTKAIQ